MLRLRFLPGLVIGLLLGLAAGVAVGVLVLAPYSPEQGGTSLQVQELTRRLETAKEDRQRVERQLEQFQKLAEQMTASFNSLEMRFKLLEEQQRMRDARDIQAAAQAHAAPPSPSAPAVAPTHTPAQPVAAPQAGEPQNAPETDPAAGEQDAQPADAPPPSAADAL